MDIAMVMALQPSGPWFHNTSCQFSDCDWYDDTGSRIETLSCHAHSWLLQTMRCWQVRIYGAVKVISISKFSKEKLIILHLILVANWLFRLFASLHYISAFRQQTTPHEAKWSKESRRWFWEAPAGSAVWQLWVSDAHELCCTTAIMLTLMQNRPLLSYNVAFLPERNLRNIVLVTCGKTNDLSSKLWTCVA